MKIAIASQGKSLESKVSDFFGRCPFFVIVEIEDGKVAKFEAIENPSAKQLGGAGISAAKTVAEKADAVIAKNIGPRALSILQQFNMEIYLAEAETVQENVEKFLEGKLKKLG